MPLAIALEHLTKVYGRRKDQVRAVDNLSLEIESGQVYGLLGPNGAGKSTTIRMILALSAPSAGRIQIFGQALAQASEVLRQRVGSLVEGATLYPFLSGRDNLRVLARTAGTYDEARIQQLLEQLDMADRADRLASGYSTGMKQRIGIAGALLNNPDLVILDEPTNGLDPRGMQDIRRFVRQLADEQGKTVLISSHLLHEVEQICDRVAIVQHGRLLREGRVSDLLSEQVRVMVEAEPLAQAQAVLQAQFVVQPNGASLCIQAGRDAIPQIVRLLSQAQVEIYGVAAQRSTLEDYFLTVTDAQSTKQEVPNAEPISG